MDFVKEIKNSVRGTRRAAPAGLDLLTFEASRQTKIPERILICRPNHRLGNLLLITPLLQEVIATFPNCKIDLFVRGNLGPAVFKSFRNIETIIQLPKRPFPHLLSYCWSWLSIRKKRYDLVIDVDKNSSGGRLSTRFANAKYKIPGNASVDLQSEYDGYQHHAKYPVYNFRKWLTAVGLEDVSKPVPPVDLRLTALEIAKGYEILKQLVNNADKTICLFTYATGKKCYPASWWENFYERLRQEYPRHNIIEILPIHNVSKLSFKLPTFYSRSIREIGSVIANTELFIGADSGMMHLSSAAQTPTIGLFSVTNENLYAPYDNNSVAINTNTSSTDDLMNVIHRILYSDSSTAETAPI